MGRKSRQVWSLCAGSCSTFMLPKITDKIGLKKLHKEYNIPTILQVKKLSDHFELFKNIAQSDNFSQKWRSPILFFGAKWFDKQHSKAWDDFKDYLLRIIWQQANFAIDKTRFNMLWEKYVTIIISRRLQPKPYIIDQIKHLLAIIANNFPAFTVMDDSQESAPSNCLQKVFVETFGIKKYLPTIMHACMPCDHLIKPEYVYYSLNIPTILEGCPIKKTTSTIVNDLREISLIIETLKNGLQTDSPFKLDKTVKNIPIDYFHYKDDQQHQIRSSSDIPIEDTAFNRDKKLFPEREFCSTSPFFSGCIRVKNDEINKHL
jgi:hypothetical protein